MNRNYCIVGKQVKTKSTVKDYPSKVGVIEKVGKQLGYDTVFVRFEKMGRDYGFAPQELCPTGRHA